MGEYSYNLETRIETFYQSVMKLINDQDIPVGVAWIVLENLSKMFHSYHNNVVDEDLQNASFYYDEQKRKELEQKENNNE